MKLKCIGGVHDGEFVYVDRYYQPGDILKVPEKLKPLDAAKLNFNPNSPPELDTVKYDLYKVSSLHFSKDDFILFAIPYNWTNKEAVLFQLNK